MADNLRAGFRNAMMEKDSCVVRELSCERGDVVDSPGS